MNQTVRHAISGALLSVLLAACSAPQSDAGRAQTAQSTQAGNTAYSAEIRRTESGIPHVRAADWGSLGFGFGYAQAEDNLCTLADAFVTYRGERSASFGADARPPAMSTFGQPRNLDADFFFRMVIDQAAVERYRAAQAVDLRDLIDGFASGYNRYLADLNAGNFPKLHAACKGKLWVDKITSDDIYRRLIAANLAGGSTRFVQAITAAQPPKPGATPRGETAPDAAPATSSTSAGPLDESGGRIALTPSPVNKGALLAAASSRILPRYLGGEGPGMSNDAASGTPLHATKSHDFSGYSAGDNPGIGTQAPAFGTPFHANNALDALRYPIGENPGIGSNALAFGAPVTSDQRSILFGNPHWFWRGPDRFYQAQLTIPGRVNVAGVSFLGVPLIVLGFNENIAWTHTVSSARRFGIFQLTLDPADSTHYMFDGRSQPMTPVPLTVRALRADGTIESVTRTLYRTRFGPVMDLSALSPALGWNTQRAYALADVNADNARAFQNFFAWNQARSLEDFMAIQKRYAAMPWANTLAIGRNDARVWFADIGAIPDVPDALADACTPPAGRALASRMPGVPFLDGSKSACAWRADGSSVQQGALPVAQMASVVRGDYVGNFNDSYWLTNANAPLTGLARVAGATRYEQSLRTRYGHLLAARLQREPGGITRDALETAVLATGSMSERLYRQPLLDAVCNGNDAQYALHDACEVLRSWNGSSDIDARGANLWDEFWQRVTRLAPERLYATPFSPDKPLDTPSGFNIDNPAVVQDLRQALGGAALALRLNGFALDSRRGDILYTTRAGERVPLYGGCDEAGYFTVVCARRPLDAKGYPMDANGQGDSYVQVVSFAADGPGGVEADTLLSHSESDDPASPHSADATRLFSAKQWARFPFTDQAIEADPAVSRTVITGTRY
ncbi:penicillin acylase family protein [Caballeronia sp. LZ001]|uniref:penicillin acylase family protein n=1 Tax=Caballeronia sp. LZ001 TaxID=3038553 RepID=UPI002858F815|nr:penicillin acylase family protein [Caballeronia sp. LZ001]MDR5802012.1 penicillin acylase family protein [Caballeronia sp. LZ001]